MAYEWDGKAGFYHSPRGQNILAELNEAITAAGGTPITGDSPAGQKIRDALAELDESIAEGGGGGEPSAHMKRAEFTVDGEFVVPADCHEILVFAVAGGSGGGGGGGGASTGAGPGGGAGGSGAQSGGAVTQRMKVTPGETLEVTVGQGGAGGAGGGGGNNAIGGNGTPGTVGTKSSIVGAVDRVEASQVIIGAAGGGGAAVAGGTPVLLTGPQVQQDTFTGGGTSGLQGVNGASHANGGGGGYGGQGGPPRGQAAWNSVAAVAPAGQVGGTSVKFGANVDPFGRGFGVTKNAAGGNGGAGGGANAGVDGEDGAVPGGGGAGGGGGGGRVAASGVAGAGGAGGDGGAGYVSIVYFTAE